MIVISSGFPKSASTLLFLYTEHLFKLAGKTGGQRIFRSINKEGFTPWFQPLNGLWYVIASIFGPVVIKTHSGPCWTVKVLLSIGLAKAYYSIRDPRDVVLSALDHGTKAREKAVKSNSDIAFAPFKTVKDMLPAMQMHFNRFKSWKKDGRVLFIRYEDLLSDPQKELEKVALHIRRPEIIAHIPATVSWFASRKKETLNFNKGDVSRYASELSAGEIADIEHDMKEVIVAMDYPLTQTA